MRFTYFSSLILITALLTLAGCGGGGGGNDQGGGVGQGLNERPRILLTSPSNGAQDVVANEIVEIIFQDSVDPASVGLQSVVVQANGGALAGTADYVAATRRLYFFPAAALPNGAEVSVTVKAGLRDLGGNERTEDYTFRFDVAAAGVGQPDEVEFTPEPSQLRTMKANAAGNGFLVYVEEDAMGDPKLRARRVLSGTTLIGDTELSQGRTIAVDQQQGLAVSENGNALLAWTEDVGGTTNAYMRYFDAQTGSWRTEETLENFPGWDAQYPSVVMDESGNALIAWYRRFDSDNSHVRVAQYSRSQGLSPIQTVSGTAAPLSSPRLHGSTNGRGILTWARMNAAGNFDAYCSQYNPFAGGWGAAEILDDYVPGHAIGTRGFIDREGYGVVVWEQWTTGGASEATLWGSFFRPGQGYDQPLQLDGIAERYRQIVAHVDSNGNGYLAFNHAENNNAAIVVYPWTRAGWQASTEVSEDGIGGLRYTTLRMLGNESGEVVVGWTQFGGSQRVGTWLTLARRAPNGAWSAPVYVGETGSGTWPPMQIAMLPDGRVSTTWIQRMDVTDIHDRARTRLVDTDGSMNDARTISVDDGRFLRNVQVVMGPAGEGLAAWTQFTVGLAEADVWTNRIP